MSPATRYLQKSRDSISEEDKKRICETEWTPSGYAGFFWAAPDGMPSCPMLMVDSWADLDNRELGKFFKDWDSGRIGPEDLPAILGYEAVP